MYKYIWAVIMMLTLLQAKAQDHTMVYQLNNYMHTVTFQDHKISFQLQPAKDLPKIAIPTKKYYWYSNNQLKITQGGYNGKLLNGAYTDFYLNNSLKEHGNFKLGLKIGEWRKWATDGTLVEITNFKDGLIHGVLYQYNPLGELIESVKYKNGVLKPAKPNWLQRKFGKKQKAIVGKT